MDTPFTLDSVPGIHMVRLDEVTSTNDFLRDYPFPEGGRIVLVTAEHQTVGRGQRGNSWESDTGCNLLFSLMVQPMCVEARLGFCLSEAIAMAVQQALCSYHDGFAVKWPNDIYYEDKKVAGILIENTLRGKLVANSIIGVGVNVNQHVFHSDAPNPISLCQIMSREVTRSQVLERIITYFSLYYDWIENGKAHQLHQFYLDNMYRRPGMFPYRDGQGEFLASIHNVEPTGHLILTDELGQDRRYAFKEVEIILSTNK